MARLSTLKPRISGTPSRLKPATANQNATPRMRGRAAVDRRAAYLRKHTLCVRCTEQGRTAIAEHVDHIIPLWAGGADDYEANGQGLCTPDHDEKTACEARMRAAGGWMATPCVCGQHEAG